MEKKHGFTRSVSGGFKCIIVFSYSLDASFQSIKLNFYAKSNVKKLGNSIVTEFHN